MKNIAVIREDLIDKKFIDETNKFKSFLIDLKSKLDNDDSKKMTGQQAENLLQEYKKNNYVIIKRHFDRIWEMVNNLDRNDYSIYQSYYQKNIVPLVGNAEVNRHIYTRPLGYAGDFITMNYIFEHHNKFIGKTLFEKVINNLTCSIPISASNIRRKEYLKKQILLTLEEWGSGAKIASVASGSAREVLELLGENKIGVPVEYSFVDFEKKALEFVKNSLSSLGHAGSKILHASFIKENVINIIRKQALRERLQGQQLIYAFGIYDYLSDVIATRLTRALFECLSQGGRLILCNASVEKTDFRAYFEFLGEWNMIYRTKEDMMRWSEKLPCNEAIIRDDPQEAYLYLIIKK